jgi:hypothetical protein
MSNDFEKNHIYDIKQANILLNNFRSIISAISVNVSKTANALEKISDMFNDYEKISKHIHGSHLHICYHNYDEFGESNIFFEPSQITETNKNPKFKESQNFKSEKTYITKILQMEYLKKSDLDKNKLKYGYDFIICEDNTENLPTDLLFVNRYIPLYKKKHLLTLTYDEYLDTLPEHSEFKSFYKNVQKGLVS